MLSAITASAALAIGVGVSLHTFHFGPDQARPAQTPRDDTPGLYVRTEDFAVGVVRNSYGRWSTYAAVTYSIATPAGPVDFNVGAITGYKRRVVWGESSCTAEERAHAARAPARPRLCWAAVGNTNALGGIMPLLTASYLLPLDLGAGTRPRLTWLGKGVHLSIEKEFR